MITWDQQLQQAACKNRRNKSNSFSKDLTKNLRIFGCMTKKEDPTSRRDPKFKIKPGKCPLSIQSKSSNNLLPNRKWTNIIKTSNTLNSPNQPKFKSKVRILSIIKDTPSRCTSTRIITPPLKDI
jgi:predicted transglutaminase-like protease